MREPRQKIVVVGGGTGSYTALLGLKKLPVELTAVVTMMDSGGSSGRLRDELGQLPPGDVRQCLVALAPDDEASFVLRQLFNYRFRGGTNLDGHSFGNLFLSALAEVMGGMDGAVLEAGRILKIRGKVLPVTLNSTQLCARLADGTIVVGERSIDMRPQEQSAPIDFVYLDPKAYVYPPVADELERADVVVLGPGDLYTSIVPNLLVEGVAEAIRKSPARKLYVCNLMTKHGESDGFKASTFIREILAYLGSDSALDCAIVNEGALPQDVVERYLAEEASPVEADLEACRALVPRVLHKRLAHAGTLVRHDPDRLARAILEAASLG
jgi:uncharacterized cofD-like protein